MNTRILIAALLLVTASACDSSSPGASGVAGDRGLASLSDSEREQLCDFYDELYGGEIRIATTCGDSPSAQVGGTHERCLQRLSELEPGCAANVEQWERCQTEAEADPCAVYDPSRCATEYITGCR